MKITKQDLLGLLGILIILCAGFCCVLEYHPKLKHYGNVLTIAGCFLTIIGYSLFRQAVEKHMKTITRILVAGGVSAIGYIFGAILLNHHVL